MLYDILERDTYNAKLNAVYKGRGGGREGSMGRQLDGAILSLSGDELWELLEQHQGEAFYTAKGLPFTYEIRGGEMFVDRRSKSITKATFQRALERVKENPEKVTGPKSLNVFGAPYVFALLWKLFEDVTAG